MQQVVNLELTNPNQAWVVAELEKLYLEWSDWQQQVLQIVDQPFDRNTHSEVYADGEGMMLKHEILQAKTLTFLNNNVKGHGFICGFDGRHIDRTDLRLSIRVKHRLAELEILKACLQYAKVPDAYWKQKGKEMVEHLAKKSGDAAIDAAASYLKNPMAVPSA
ncbi:hypothetical protein [Geothrix alkalitolerans]|uniref:hypothetical protein n=1 Tax=Geothrix alkalitolerans TaxID=2922724 RepID=UPI001FAFEF2E|nr:hypothetical protein [Geothrix alkalitolerans]